MSCTYLTRGASPAPIWHRALCKDCRKIRRADSLIAFALACRKAESVPATVLARSLAALELPHSIPRPGRYRMAAFSRRAKKTAALAMGGLALAGFGWTRYIEIDPNIAIPTPAITGPNAFDDFQRAAALLKDEDLAAYMLLPSRRLEPQSMPAMGGGMIKQGVPANQKGAPAATIAPERSPTYTLAEKEALLSQNEPALRAIREGYGKTYLAPPARSFTAAFPYYSTYRSMARLLLLDAEVAEARHRWAAAVQSRLDAMELGTTIQQNAPVLGKRVGNACHAIGSKGIWPAINRLSGAEARSAAARLQTILARRVGFADALLEETWFILAGLQEEMREPGWRPRILLDSEDDNVNQVQTGPPRWYSYLVLLPYSKSKILGNVSKYMNEHIKQAQQPFLPDTGQDYLGNLDPVSRRILPAFFDARFKDTVTQTGHHLLVTVLALRAYRAERGHYPAELRALNAMDPSLRLDPFGQYREFGYRLAGGKYVLYSVGPDGNDDGGASIVNPDRSHREPKYPQSNSSGDIVAGSEPVLAAE